MVVRVSEFLKMNLDMTSYLSLRRKLTYKAFSGKQKVFNKPFRRLAPNKARVNTGRQACFGFFEPHSPHSLPLQEPSHPSNIPIVEVVL